ncbi:MAG: hypothetical protein ACK42I_07610, partial [Thermomicrobium sp.]
VPACHRQYRVVLMAQLENVRGLGGSFARPGGVSVTCLTDGGITWSEPITGMKEQGAGIGLARSALFFEKYATSGTGKPHPHRGSPSCTRLP